MLRAQHKLGLELPAGARGSHMVVGWEKVCTARRESQLCAFLLLSLVQPSPQSERPGTLAQWTLAHLAAGSVAISTR